MDANRVVSEFCEAWGSADLDSIMDAFADDAVYHNIPMEPCKGKPAIEAFIKIAEGTDWKEAGIPGLPMRVSHDIRSYYETAALAMVDHAPAAWAGTRWFYEQTETGKVMMAARKAMEEQEASQPMWFYLAPGDR